MFKRVEKRRRKQEEEEELGLNEEMKEIMGMHDTDSDESDSDSDSDSDASGDGGNGEDVGDDEDDFRSGLLAAQDSDEDVDANGVKQDPELTIQQALEDPIYVVSVNPDVKSCLVCPDKLLKTPQMIPLHRTSNGHGRRFKAFKLAAANVKSTDSAWELWKRTLEKRANAPDTTAVSKRAERRKARKEMEARRRAMTKDRREQKAARRAAKALAAQNGSSKEDSPTVIKSSKKEKSKKAEDSTTTKPSVDQAPKKKRKLEDATVVSVPSQPEAGDSETAPSPKKSKVEKEKKKRSKEPAPTPSVKSIVRSTADRAKNARSKALKA